MDRACRLRKEVRSKTQWWDEVCYGLPRARSALAMTWLLARFGKTGGVEPRPYA